MGALETLETRSLINASGTEAGPPRYVAFFWHACLFLGSGFKMVGGGREGKQAVLLLIM